LRQKTKKPALRRAKIGGIKDPLENGGLLLSYVAISSVETIMLANSLAWFHSSVNSFLDFFLNFFDIFTNGHIFACFGNFSLTFQQNFARNACFFRRNPL
jgi:hypothetical protein